MSMRVFVSAAVLLISSSVFAGGAFPTGPDDSVTPGSVCEHGDSRRYPEGIEYCSRNVDSELKWEIIRQYDSELGYSIEKTGRGKFKIDHLIPLCAGGSNERDNLWPQHESVYKITDPLEPEICGKMAAGRLKQAEAIELVIKAKHNLNQVSQILKYVRSL